MLILIEKDSATRVPREVRDLVEAAALADRGFTISVQQPDGSALPLDDALAIAAEQEAEAVRAAEELKRQAQEAEALRLQQEAEAAAAAAQVSEPQDTPPAVDAEATAPATDDQQA